MGHIGTTTLVVLHEGWVVVALEYGQAPLYFWPGGPTAQALVAAAGGDGTAADTLEAWQAAMARVSAALLAAGFVVIPGGAGDSPRQALTRGEEAAEANRRGY